MLFFGGSGQLDTIVGIRANFQDKLRFAVNAPAL